MTTQSIYVIRKGDMVIRPNYDENNQQNGSEILRYDKSIIQSPFKVQKIIERSCKFYGNNYLSKKQKLIVLQVFLVNPDFINTHFSYLFFPNTF